MSRVISPFTEGKRGEVAGSLVDRVREALTDTPQRPKALAAALGTTHRTLSSALSVLKRRGRARLIARGQWVANRRPPVSPIREHRGRPQLIRPGRAAS